MLVVSDILDAYLPLPEDLLGSYERTYALTSTCKYSSEWSLDHLTP